MSSSILRTKSFDFAVRIVRLVQRLEKENKEYVLSKQILRCGTSSGALSREAQFAQSKRDFINKLSIGLKEINETEYFLALLHATDYLSQQEFESLNGDCNELKATSISSIKTAKENLRLGIGIIVLTISLSTLLFSLFA
jgi:four helix bundle protein